MDHAPEVGSDGPDDSAIGPSVAAADPAFLSSFLRVTLVKPGVDPRSFSPNLMPENGLISLGLILVKTDGKNSPNSLIGLDL